MIKALVVDDNRDAANTVCKMLKLLDVTARPAYGPRESMLVLKDFSPDIVFLDINMPGIDGFEVMSYMQRIPEMETVPFVFITSDDQPETAGKVRKTGALLTIVKPASLDSLENALKKAGLLR